MWKEGGFNSVFASVLMYIIYAVFWGEGQRGHFTPLVTQLPLPPLKFVLSYVRINNCSNDLCIHESA